MVQWSGGRFQLGSIPTLSKCFFSLRVKGGCEKMRTGQFKLVWNWRTHKVQIKLTLAVLPVALTTR